MQKKGKTYWACCPFHHEKTPSFAVNEIEQYYHCFGCGESGDVIKFVSKFENMTFAESVKTLADSCGLKMPELAQTTKDLEELKEKQQVLLSLNLATQFYKNALKNGATQAQEYLKKREISSEVADYFNIGFSPDWNTLVDYLQSNKIELSTMKKAGLIEYNSKNKPYDVFATRLIFPIQNAFGDTIGFTARTLEANSTFAKYKNSTQTIVFDKSKTIYNIHTIKQLKKEQNLNYIIICEGTIDVIAMFGAGFKNTVACLGTAITPQHAQTLKKYCDKVILCLDGDDAGQNAMFKAIDILYDEGLEVRAVKLKDNLDPDEYIKKYGKDSIKECFEKALDAYEYKIRSLALRYDLNDTYKKNNYISQAIQIINKFESNSQKEIYLKILAKIVNISVDVLRRDVMSSSNTQKATIETPISNENSNLPFRPQGEIKAQQFVLASIIHKKDFAMALLSQNIKFDNPSHQKLFEFAKKCFEQNKTYTISTLFDYFDVEENEDIKAIIDFDFSKFGDDLQKYFNQCYKKMIIRSLEQKQEELTKLFKVEKDLSKRREIANQLFIITKEIKQNGDKD